MDIQKIRQDFPFFTQKNADKNGKAPLVYFDNACMTLKPKSVIDAEIDYYQNYSSCGGRSMHSLGEAVTKKADEARQQIAKFIGAKKDEIIFVKNTTEAINLVAHSFDFKPSDIIFTSDKEHNSNLIPWQIAAKKSGALHEVIYSKNDNTFDLEKFERAMSPKVKMVALGLTSNLDGVTIPAKEIIKIAHKFGAKVLLDAAQAAGHQKIDVKDLDVDFLAFSGHKMLGPTGTGVLYGKKEILAELDPFIVGGGTVDFSDYR
ncbi:MAG: aminotransferase class V-fold PLP-dependent enzyme, partial [Patescibacteria group bacterium]